MGPHRRPDQHGRPALRWSRGRGGRPVAARGNRQAQNGDPGRNGDWTLNGDRALDDVSGLDGVPGSDGVPGLDGVPELDGVRRGWLASFESNALTAVL